MLSSAAPSSTVSFWIGVFLPVPFSLHIAIATLHRRGYTSPASGEVVELYAFDEAYLARLREGDPSTEAHFVDYFSQLLQLKLRARYLGSEVVDDLRQETFARVIRTLRSESGIHQPDR